MKLTKHLILLASLATASLAGAQVAGQSGAVVGGGVRVVPPVESKREMLREALMQVNLTPDQMTRIKALQVQHQMDAKMIRREFKGAPNSAPEKARLQDLQKAFREHIVALLSPTQRAKFTAILKADHAK